MKEMVGWEHMPSKDTSAAVSASCLWRGEIRVLSCLRDKSGLTFLGCYSI